MKDCEAAHHHEHDFDSQPGPLAVSAAATRGTAPLAGSAQEPAACGSYGMASAIEPFVSTASRAAGTRLNRKLTARPAMRFVGLLLCAMMSACACAMFQVATCLEDRTKDDPRALQLSMTAVRLI